MDAFEELAIEQERQAYAEKRRRISREELTIIKKKMGLRVRDPLPLCPAKNMTKARKIAETGGDNIHITAGHQCPECSCTRYAGSGTSHFGWGWCANHERGRRRSKAVRFAEDHLRALQQRNPKLMLRSEEYMDAIGEEALVATTEFRMAPAASKVYNMLDSFYSLMSRYESDKHVRDDSVVALVNLRDELKGKEVVDQELMERICDTLESIENKLKFPMTERGGREMSSEVRFKLLTTTLKDVVSAMKLMQDISNVNSISVERFKVWLNKLHRNAVGEFGEQSYITKDGTTERIMKGLAIVFATTGEPSK